MPPLICFSGLELNLMRSEENESMDDKLIYACCDLLKLNRESEICDRACDDGGCTDVWQSRELEDILSRIKTHIKPFLDPDDKSFSGE